MALLEAFVHDPLINWRLLTPTDAAAEENADGTNSGVVVGSGPNSNLSSASSRKGEAEKGDNVSSSSKMHEKNDGKVPVEFEEEEEDDGKSYDESEGKVNEEILSPRPGTSMPASFAASLKAGTPLSVLVTNAELERKAKKAKSKRKSAAAATTVTEEEKHKDTGEKGDDDEALDVVSTSASVAKSLAESIHANRGDMEREMKHRMGPEGTDAPRERLNARAVLAINRVRAKLTGRDFDDNIKLDVADQVDRLIKQATSHENLLLFVFFGSVKASTFSPLSHLDAITHAVNITGFGQKLCQPCGPLECIPHLNFDIASKAGDYMNYLEINCNDPKSGLAGLALARNTPTESAMLGYWNATSLLKFPTISSLSTLKRGAVYQFYVNGKVIFNAFHTSGFVPCKSTIADKTIEPVYSMFSMSRNGVSLNSKTMYINGSGGGIDVSSKFALSGFKNTFLKPKALFSDDVFACNDAEDKSFLVNRANSTQEIFSGACIQSIIQYNSRYLLSYSLDKSIYFLLADNYKAPETYRKFPGKFSVEDGEELTTYAMTQLQNGSVLLLYGICQKEQKCKAYLAVSDDIQKWNILKQYVLEGDESHWDANIFPTSLISQNNGQVLAIYTGTAIDSLHSGGSKFPGSSCSRAAIGAATISDALKNPWTKFSLNPLIPPSTYPKNNFDATFTNDARCSFTGKGETLTCLYLGKNELGENREEVRVGERIFTKEEIEFLQADHFLAVQ
eukprot:g611.t1